MNNDNTKPSIPVAHSAAMKETYENMSVILKAVNYNEDGWEICGDLKVIVLLFGYRESLLSSVVFFYFCGTVEQQYNII